jgi:hypothetical protein
MIWQLASGGSGIGPSGSAKYFPSTGKEVNGREVVDLAVSQPGVYSLRMDYAKPGAIVAPVKVFQMQIRGH